eukprot:scaffold821_cov122-Cylindrotheca_fusiformis.AAC.8
MRRIRKPLLILLVIFLTNVTFLLLTLSSSYEIDTSPASPFDGVTKMKQVKAKRRVKVIDASHMEKMFIYNPASWDAAPIVVEEYKLIFFTTGKVSCTVFKQLFRRMMHLDDWNVNAGLLPHDPSKNGLKYLYQYPPRKALKMMTSKHDNWTRAIFVRDPLERLLSAYLDKGMRKGGQYVARHCNRERQDLSFREFIQVIRSSCRHDPHWMPQIERIDPPFWNSINFVGNFDSLQKDTRTLLERVDAWDDYGSSGWGPYHNDSIFSKDSHAKHETGSSQYVDQYYNDSVVKELALQFYRQDYSNPFFHFPKNLRKA